MIAARLRCRDCPRHKKAVFCCRHMYASRSTLIATTRDKKTECSTKPIATAIDGHSFGMTSCGSLE